MKQNTSKHKLLTSQADAMKLLMDRHYEVQDIFPVSERNCLAQFKFKDDYAPIVPNSSVLIGILVTSYARLELLKALDEAMTLYGTILCKSAKLKSND